MRKHDHFHEQYQEKLHGLYDSLDRIVFIAYNSLLQTAGGFRFFWRELYGDDSKLTTENCSKMAGDFSRRLEAFCRKSGVPFVDATGERKCDAAKVEIPEDPGFTGLFLVQKSLATGPVWRVDRSAEKGHIIKIYRPKKWPFVRHFFFHIMDPQWGHVTIRMCAHPPFGAMVIVNGHEWIRRVAKREGLDIVMDGNCFIEGTDFEGVGKIASDLGHAIENADRMIDRWIHTCCLCFGLTTRQQEQTGFSYQYSALQMEYSRNYVFTRGSDLDQIYQSIVDRARNGFDLARLQTVLGFKRRPRTQPAIEIRRSRGAKGSHDLTMVTIRWGPIKLKIYDKSGRLLRAEVTVENTKKLKCKRTLPHARGIIGDCRRIHRVVGDSSPRAWNHLSPEANGHAFYGCRPGNRLPIHRTERRQAVVSSGQSGKTPNGGPRSQQRPRPSDPRHSTAAGDKSVRFQFTGLLGKDS